MKRTAIIAAVIMAFALTGCGEEEEIDYKLQNIERGKACFEAGGDWEYNAWNGYVCEFHQGEGDADE